MAIVIGTGSFLLFFSLAVNVVALMVPYWYSTGGSKNYGLWGTCTCDWYYKSADDAFKDTRRADWFKASQWLYAAGVALMGMALFMLFIVACCSEKVYAKAMTAAGALMLIAAVLVAVSIVVFGVKGHDDLGLNIDGRNRFDWGMWMGVAGFGIALCTAIVFLIQGSRI
ncbi:hypothetical protein LSH36_40g04009 [Paralvinella palmiformis]|uniref:Uncharacterized protein n=1 Tax=Paralvinella palmiformis TaxID=53620 RepID=A0AAD9K7H5_9ANNE|nr:hypothetical protein LSH36_40g04009 [Paralvinella palmiformis]